MEEKHFGPVWFIPGENRGKYPYCHSVYLAEARVLLDPASDRRRLMELRRGPGVREVWLSHWHEDHLMHLDLFEDLPLVISEADAPPLADLEVFLDWYGLEGEAREWWRPVLQDQFHYRPRRPARFFSGRRTIQVGGLEVEVIPAPGHTPGHLAFYFPEVSVLFLADYDLGKFGPWYGDLDSSIEDTIASVEMLRKIPARVLLTGHETGVFEETDAAVFDRYLNVIALREEKLLDFLNGPKTLDEIAEAWIVYGRPREPKGFFEYGERAIMKKHLERLIKKKIIQTEKDRYVKL